MVKEWFYVLSTNLLLSSSPHKVGFISFFVGVFSSAVSSILGVFHKASPTDELSLSLWKHVPKHWVGEGVRDKSEWEWTIWIIVFMSSLHNRHLLQWLCRTTCLILHSHSGKQFPQQQQKLSKTSIQWRWNLLVMQDFPCPHIQICLHYRVRRGMNKKVTKKEKENWILLLGVFVSFCRVGLCAGVGVGLMIHAMDFSV